MDACDCPLNELREAVKAFLRWESFLFGTSVALSQSELDTASDAYTEARDRMWSLVDMEE